MQLTINDLPESLDFALRRRASLEGKSFDQVVTDALKAYTQGGDTPSPAGTKQRDLSFMRSDPADVQAIRDAHHLCDVVDPEAWK